MGKTSHLKTLVLATLSLAAFACSESDESENYRPQNYNVSGKVEKGPFVSGSTITVQPLNAKMQPLGEMYTSTIQDNAGSFTFGSKLFNAPFAELTANGYFFNEVEGELSSGTLNLRAIVDLSDQSTIHVNILTHLKYQRVLTLVEQGRSFKEANTQAQEELFAAFGLSRYAATDASRFSIVGGNEEAAALVAVSSLLLIDRSEAGVTEYLAELCREFGQNGGFSSATLQQMEKDREKLWKCFEEIRGNIVRRYEELGMTVGVKDLKYFFDWDGDGVAGNEIVPEGEEVTLENTRIEVPGEGGSYRIRITSPVPVYLTPKVGFWELPGVSVPESFGELYEEIPKQEMTVEKELADNVLTVKVAPANSRTEKKTTIYLYDCIGTVLGAVEVVQEGADIPVHVPLLGKGGRDYVNGMAIVLAYAFAEYNLLQQLYHYNKQADLVEQNVRPTCAAIVNSWDRFWLFNKQNVSLKQRDADWLGVYQDICNVFSALQYYYMVAAWGDMLYITDYKWYEDNNWGIARTDAAVILSKLEDNLQQAIGNLEEKKNESLSDANGFFFVSKDVARVLLADIYMYRQKYDKAEQLLGEVIRNGFYQLDNSNYSNRETIDRLLNDRSGKEVLFAVYNDRNNTYHYSDIELLTPSVIPVQTYTEVMLSYAECLYKQGRAGEAGNRLNEVIEAKNIRIDSNDVLGGIAEARRQLLLYGLGNFAFFKRNGLAQDAYGVEAYRLLFPLPSDELNKNPLMTQNPGY